MNMRHYLFALLLAANTVCAQPALQELRTKALAGDADAQFHLGGLYYKGGEVAKDDKEAAKWLQLAADQGLPQAQYNLGMMYDAGQGVAPDHEQAARWYRLAAKQGLALAQLNIGVAYATGEGVAKDEAEAVKWFRLAADQNEASAQFNLGIMYANGQGVQQDLIEAYRLAKRAEAKGHETAGTLIKDLTARMSPEQIAQADKVQPTPAAPAVREPEKTSAVYVQLGAFKSQEPATEYLNRMREKLGELDQPYSLHKSSGWHRIFVGPYPNRDEAQKSADKLKTTLGFEPKIRQP